MLELRPTTPQDYPEWSGFARQREREWVIGGSGPPDTQENPPMRIYVIGNDGITLCREPLATVSEGEIAVTSKEELQAAPLSGKRLLALWNALPGDEKRKESGERAAQTDELWSRSQTRADPEAH